MALLEARDLIKSYNGRKVVDGVSFTVNAGEVVGLLGRNGAGKTTSFRMAIGMITPEGGAVSFNGKDVTHEPMYRHALAGMGYLSQEPSIFQRLTCEENLIAILETQALSREQCKARARELLEQFGLVHKSKDEARTCSGDQMRAGGVRAGGSRTLVQGLSGIRP
ncbi:MAG: ATP-binding cassette domain-containing protein [Phycisphaerales bacterium]